MTKATRRHRASRRLATAAIVSCALIAWAGAVMASTTQSAQPAVLTLGEAAQLLRIGSDELERMARRGEVPARRIGTRWRFNRAALLAWVNGDWKLIVTAVPPGTQPLATPALDRIAGAGTSIAQDTSKPADGAQEPIGEAPKERTAEDVFLRGQKVLLGPGEVTTDMGLFYSKSDNQQLSLVNGSIGLATVEQETLTTLLLGRVGVFAETEIFASTTFSDRDSDVFLGNQKIADSNRTEFGDVRLGVRRTLMKEGPGRPNVIATIDGRIPTGDTSWAIGGGLALVKSVDPAVLFANGNYRHTFSRDFADVTRLEPEDRFDVSLGYALALNDTLTISSSVSGVFTSATRFDNAKLRQQENFSMSFGLTSWLAKGLYIEPSVSFGLSGPGNSFAFGVLVPYSF